MKKEGGVVRNLCPTQNRSLACATGKNMTVFCPMQQAVRDD